MVSKRWNPIGIWDGTLDAGRVFASPEAQRKFYDFVQSRKGYVYAISNSLRPGWIKVGRTAKNPFERAQTLKTAGSHGEFNVLWVQKHWNAPWAEVETHRRLSEYPSDREWFQADLEVVKTKMAMVAQLEMERLRHLQASHLDESYEEWDALLAEGFDGYISMI